MNLKRKLVAGAAAMVGAFALALPSAAEDKPNFNAAEKQEIRDIVKEYLLEQPELLRDVFAELNKRQELAAQESRKKALSSLYKKETPFSFGEGDITIVEFFDYNCGYCRKAFDDIAELVKQEKDVRVVFVEFPILSEGSRVASEAAIAATKQNKYWEFHRALMEYNGPIQPDTVFKIAKDVGLDIDKLKKDMKEPEVAKIIQDNLQLGTSMGVQGTPAFFVGDEAIPGAPTELRSILMKEVANIRENGCSVC